MADLWRFQSSEISSAALAAEDEDAQLEAEKRVLGNVERLYTAAMSAHEVLYEAEQSVESMLGAALKNVEELARFDARFEGAAQQLAAAKAGVEDVSTEVRDFADNLSASPERVDEIEERLEALDRLKRKYGKTLAEVMAFGAEASARLAEVENRDALLAELKAKQAEEAKAYVIAAGGGWTALRVASAGRLEKRSEGQINDLAMKTRFHVQVTPEKVSDGWTAHGWGQGGVLDRHEYGRAAETSRRDCLGWGDVACHAGAEGDGRGRRPRVRSGGRSRFCREPLSSTEIDIGIGGRAAEAVGQKLKTLSQGQQVLWHHASSADCRLRRSAFSDCEDGEGRADADGDSAHG